MVTCTDIVLDLYLDNYVSVQAKQFDKNSRQISVSLTQYGEPFAVTSDLNAKVKMRKPDGKGIFNDCDVKDGKIIIILTGQMLLSAGAAPVDVVLISNDEILSTMTFTLNIVKSALPNGEIESSNEFSALIEALKKCENWDDYFKGESEELKEECAKKLEAILQNDYIPALEQYISNCKNSAEASARSASEADNYALESESYAHGGTGIRTGENTDNSKYYSEQSAAASATAKSYAEQAEAAGDEAVKKINDAITTNLPIFQVDFSNGHLQYEGGRFDFYVADATGHLMWEVAV